MAEEHLATRSIGRIELANALEAKHVRVPGRARFCVADREAEVTEAVDHAAPMQSVISASFADAALSDVA